jgi:hypothetical protein
VIEWANRFTGVIPSSARWVYFQMISANERTIEFK